MQCQAGTSRCQTRTCCGWCYWNHTKSWPDTTASGAQCKRRLQQNTQQKKSLLQPAAPQFDMGPYTNPRTRTAVTLIGRQTQSLLQHCQQQQYGTCLSTPNQAGYLSTVPLRGAWAASLDTQAGMSSTSVPACSCCAQENPARPHAAGCWEHAR